MNGRVRGKRLRRRQDVETECNARRDGDVNRRVRVGWNNYWAKSYAKSVRDAH